MNGRKTFGGGRGRAGQNQQGRDGQQRRPMFRRRRVCKFCADKIDDINYKDTRLLMPFVPERGEDSSAPHLGNLCDAPAKAARRHHARATAGAYPVHVGVDRL